jgi:hypothetical protein
LFISYLFPTQLQIKRKQLKIIKINKNSCHFISLGNGKQDNVKISFVCTALSVFEGKVVSPGAATLLQKEIF